MPLRFRACLVPDACDADGYVARRYADMLTFAAEKRESREVRERAH